jgi:hypothetical protein
MGMDSLVDRVSVRDGGIDLDLRRYFVISAGRTGSTLLSAILADAGAEFGMRAPPGWDRATGAMEHPDLLTACRRYAAADAMSPAKPQGTLRRYRWTLLRFLGKRRLRASLAATRFVKVGHAHLLIRPVLKLGYFPPIILSYRRFEDHAISLGMMAANANLEQLVEQYNRINKSALWLLNTFGGCVIGYEQLIDPADRSWAESLAEIAHLPAGGLLAARERRAEAPSHHIKALCFDRTARQTFDDLETLRGLVIPPSAQALRSWRPLAVAR